MKYELTLIPFKEGERVVVDGRDYTTAASSHSVTLNGQKYYVRQNHEGNVRRVESLIESMLEKIEGELHSHLAPIKITIEKQD